MSGGTRLTILVVLVATAFLTLNLMRSRVLAAAYDDNSPWISQETTIIFMEQFVNKISNTGYFSPEEIAEIDSIVDILITTIDDMSLLGKTNRITLRAINMAFASAMAEILTSESGGESMSEKLDAIIDSLEQTFLQTIGVINTKFINEVIQLMRMFSKDSNVAITKSASVSSSSYAGGFDSGGIKRGTSEANLNAAKSTASNGWQYAPQVDSGIADYPLPLDKSNAAVVEVVFEKGSSINGEDSVAAVPTRSEQRFEFNGYDNRNYVDYDNSKFFSNAAADQNTATPFGKTEGIGSRSHDLYYEGNGAKDASEFTAASSTTGNFPSKKSYVQDINPYGDYDISKSSSDVAADQNTATAFAETGEIGLRSRDLYYEGNRANDETPITGVSFAANGFGEKSYVPDVIPYEDYYNSKSSSNAAADQNTATDFVGTGEIASRSYDLYYGGNGANDAAAIIAASAIDDFGGGKRYVQETDPKAQSVRVKSAKNDINIEDCDQEDFEASDDASSNRVESDQSGTSSASSEANGITEYDTYGCSSEGESDLVPDQVSSISAGSTAIPANTTAENKTPTNAIDATLSKNNSGNSNKRTPTIFQNLEILLRNLYRFIIGSSHNILPQLYSPSSLSRVSNTVSQLKSGKLNFISMSEVASKHYQAVIDSEPFLSLSEVEIQVLLELANSFITVLRTSELGSGLDLIVAYILYMIIPVSKYKGLDSNGMQGILNLLSVD